MPFSAVALIEGAATAASGPLYAAYAGRTYLLMAAMGIAGVLLSLILSAAGTRAS